MNHSSWTSGLAERIQIAWPGARVFRDSQGAWKVMRKATEKELRHELVATQAARNNGNVTVLLGWSYAEARTALTRLTGVTFEAKQAVNVRTRHARKENI